MANKSEVKERGVFNKICSILIDIFIIPVLIVAFVCAILMSSAKANNKVPSVFGNSIVEVLTNSMDVGTKESYKVGDVLIIDQAVNLDELKVGDCIAFYAPKQSKFTTDGTVNGDSLVIFHRIVRIVYAKEVVNGVESEQPKRHFVCHGDNADSLEFIPTQAKIDGLSNPGGDYDEQGNVLPGGGYVVKLLDDTDVATGENEVQSNQSSLQYVTDQYVVGKLKSRAGGFLSALVKFCCSELGIILLVIIPSSIMICIIIVNLVQEAKIAKQERESDQLVFAKNMSTIGGNDIDSSNVQNEVIAEPNAPDKKEEKAVQTASKLVEKQEEKQATPKAPKAPSAPKAPAQKPPAMPKTAPAMPKTAPAKPNVEPVKPKVAPTTKGAEPKTTPQPQAPKTVPNKVPPKKS